jgi:hypothetical protein
MVTELQSLARPSPDGDRFLFSPAQETLLLRLVEMMGNSVPNKAF